MLEIPAARPRSTLHANPTMTSESASADRISTSSATCARRLIRVRKYVKGNAITMQTAPASRQMPIENSVRSTNTGCSRRRQLSSSKAGV
ncbi:MAG: hypothetical protein KatS3mg014_1568 [Actinomycetota bacterium]|nr:MAG: hypothetical protein KatS3mg014_1568 [Actinomycetota bacterium]